MVRRFTFRPLFAIISLLLPLIALSCAQGSPDIRASSVQLLRVQGAAGLFAERLSLFVFFDDSDGTVDYGSISLREEDTGYVWTIRPEDTMVRLRGSDRWYGTNSLAGPGDESFPEGEYTLTVTDLVGNEATKVIDLKRPKFPAAAPVKFSIEGDRWKLSLNPDAGDFTVTWLFLLDDQARLLYSWKVPYGGDTHTEGPVANFRTLAAGTASVQCYTENTAGTAGVLLSPVDIQ
jgi:hypothetical protein